MKIKILGKYGPFATNGNSTSGYLVEANNNLALLDLGSGTVSKFLQNFCIDNLSFVFLSHLHFDHISDFGVLSYAINFLRKNNKKINLYLPNDNSKILEVLKGTDAFNLIFIEENKEYKDGDFSFYFCKMQHPVLTFGINLKANDKVFAYSGDTASTLGLDELTKNAHLFLCDGAFLENDYTENKPHLSVKKVCDYANLKGLKTIITHQNFAYLDSQVEGEIKRFSSFCQLAKEGKEYIL